MSAFYFECPEKQLCINAHIWTKSKFMGMSVGVNLIGDITLSVGGIKSQHRTAPPLAVGATSSDVTEQRHITSQPADDDLNDGVSDEMVSNGGAAEKLIVNNSVTNSVNSTSTPSTPRPRDDAYHDVNEGVETYVLSMPSAFARSILTEPWAELGGRVNIQCVESGFVAPVIFHTKVCSNVATGVN